MDLLTKQRRERVGQMEEVSGTDEWIKKLQYTYTMEYCSAIKRKKLESVDLRWMNLESVIQSEMPEREK